MKRFFLIAVLMAVLFTGCAPAPAGSQNTEPSSDPDDGATAETITVSAQPEASPDRIVTLIASMTTEELVGQLFLARFPGTEQAAADLNAYHLGGYILFSKDFKQKTPEVITSYTAHLQSCARIPLLLAVDEEGGTVTRVSSYPQYRESRFPSPRSLYEQGGLPLVLQTEEEKCKLLRSLGINVNMAPVCDVTTDPNAFMFSRSLGQSPQITGQYISSVVETMDKEVVGSVLKHFPGYGNNTDTHIGTAVDDRALASLEAVDLVPFRAGIDAGCDAVLVSHTIVTCLDGTAPASLSPAVIGYLRSSMGFEGVIATDDLAMDAIADVYGVGEAAILAVLAGNDLLCSSDYAVQYTAVLDAVNTGRISIDRIQESAARILCWKYKLGLI